MGNLLQKLILYAFVAFGVILGACLLAGIASILSFQPPSLHMKSLAEKLKIWAVVVAIGGSIDPIRVIESNFADGQISESIKQILYILSAFIGAHLGTKLIQMICDGGGQS